MDRNILTNKFTDGENDEDVTNKYLTVHSKSGRRKYRSGELINQWRWHYDRSERQCHGVRRQQENIVTSEVADKEDTNVQQPETHEPKKWKSMKSHYTWQSKIWILQQKWILKSWTNRPEMNC